MARRKSKIDADAEMWWNLNLALKAIDDRIMAIEARAFRYDIDARLTALEAAQKPHEPTE